MTHTTLSRPKPDNPNPVKPELNAKAQSRYMQHRPRRGGRDAAGAAVMQEAGVCVSMGTRRDFGEQAAVSTHATGSPAADPVSQNTPATPCSCLVDLAARMPA